MAKSEWTIDTLKEHHEAKLKALDDKIDGVDRLYKQRLDTLDSTLEKTDQTTKDTNAKSNEFRASLDDSNKNKVDRTEEKADIQNIDSKIKELNKLLDDKIEGANSRFEKGISEVKVSIDSLRGSRDVSSGKEMKTESHTQQQNFNVGLWVGIGLTFLTSIISIILSLKK